MSKNNIRSFRYSDEVAKILESFNGNSLNEKFENLVLYCFKVLPDCEKRKKKLDEEISERLGKISDMDRYCRDIETMIRDLEKLKDEIGNLSKAPAFIMERLGKKK